MANGPAEAAAPAKRNSRAHYLAEHFLDRGVDVPTLERLLAQYLAFPSTLDEPDEPLKRLMPAANREEGPGLRPVAVCGSQLNQTLTASAAAASKVACGPRAPATGWVAKMLPSGFRFITTP